MEEEISNENTVTEAPEETTNDAPEETKAEESSEAPRDDRKMYPAKCSECGKDCEVPFEPKKVSLLNVKNAL